MSKKQKSISVVMTVITLILLTWMIYEILVNGYNDFTTIYNIQPIVTISILVAGEAFFDFGMLLMIIGSKIIKKPTWKHLFVLDFKHVDFNNKEVYFGFFLNRTGDYLFPIYFLSVANFKLPQYIFFLLLLDIALASIITLIPIFYIKMQKG